MKKKYAAAGLAAAGAVLLCLSAALTMAAAAGRNIIGGADLPTFLFVFFHEKRGLYAALGFSGIAVMAATLVLCLIKRKK